MKMYLPPPGEKASRRSLLRKGFWGGVLLSLGGAGFLAFRKGPTARVPAGLLVLDEREYAVVSALVARLIPRRQGFPPAEELETATAVDRVLAMEDDSTRREVKQLLVLFENALPTFLFGGRTLPFTALATDEQDRVLEEWMTSRLSLRRTGYLALRTLVNAAYYGNPAVWPAVGYPGPPAGVYNPAAPVWKGGDAPRPAAGGTP
jgi:Gluconate 2-dehydrogenase subunit 3